MWYFLFVFCLNFSIYLIFFEYDNLLVSGRFSTTKFTFSHQRKSKIIYRRIRKYCSQIYQLLMYMYYLFCFFFFFYFELFLAASALFYVLVFFFVYVFCWNNEYILGNVSHFLFGRV